MASPVVSPPPVAATEAKVISPTNGKVTHAAGKDKIINKIRKRMEEGRAFYSFEYFPPKTEEGKHNLYARLERMSWLEPLFMDVTWGAGGTTADSTLEISVTAQHFWGELMMHLTCTNMPREKIDQALEKAKEGGIRNILALRGDPPKGMDTWEACEDGFSHAVDLVRYIRQKYGDYFGICVAGYPEGHLQSKSIDEDIKYLKEKVDAGADFIITQLFYDVDNFVAWVDKCRKAGITVPIIPGIMPIQDYGGFKRMTGFCKTMVPQEILDALEPIQADDARVKAYGVELAVRMCRRLLEAGCPGLHFYTLNLEKSVTSILEVLGFVSVRKPGTLPWKTSQAARRDKEEIRPIFWANRPQSYLTRTETWDEFPNGRWGDSRSPAFGDLSDYHLASFKTGKREERLKLWGSAPATPADIFNVFAGYIEGKVSHLPWCEHSLQTETIPLKESLSKLNRHGFLTINSQPRVNGAKSDDPSVGWGAPNGYVYQKAYLEFFTSRTNLEKLVKLAPEFPFISFQAVDVNGQVITNIPFEGKAVVNAVTWGVWPNKEVVQPTVVDSYSFLIWKDEAFALWKSQWQSIYPEHSPSHDLIGTIHDTYFLVNVVDNDYVNGDLMAFLDRLL